jgi:hypothetical protein
MLPIERIVNSEVFRQGIPSCREVEAIADILEYVTRNQIEEDVTIHSDAQEAIAQVGHIGMGSGQDREIRVVKAIHHWAAQGWWTSIEWVPGYTGIAGNGRDEYLAGKAASGKTEGTNFDCLAKRIHIPILQYGERYRSTEGETLNYLTSPPKILSRQCTKLPF